MMLRNLITKTPVLALLVCVDEIDNLDSPVMCRQIMHNIPGNVHVRFVKPHVALRASRLSVGAY